MARAFSYRAPAKYITCTCKPWFARNTSLGWPQPYIPPLFSQLEEGATLHHAVVQDHAVEALHVKTTAVRQAARSNYHEVEVNLGGSLGRHDVRVAQEQAPPACIPWL